MLKNEKIIQTAEKKGNFRKKAMREIRNHGALYALAIPGIIALILFSYMPMFGLVMVFKSYNYKDGIFGSPWVGLKNFEFLILDIQNALRATSNTIILNLLFIVVGTVLAIAVAIMVNELESKIVKKISQSLMFFPYFISWVAMGAILHLFMDEGGVINNLITAFGGTPVSWYMEAEYWRPILLIVYLLKNTGYTSIIYFAAITGFDPAYYEAAAIDGASRLRQIFSITVPMLKPTIVIMFLLSIGRILCGDLGMIMGTTSMNPLLLSTTDIVETYVYRSALQHGQFEMSSAIALYQSVFGFALVLFSNWVVGKFEKDYRLF